MTFQAKTLKSLLYAVLTGSLLTLATASQEIQQKGGVQIAKTPGADLSPTEAEAGAAASDTEKPNTTEKNAVKVAAQFQ